jgi:hypothetical protein
MPHRGRASARARREGLSQARRGRTGGGAEHAGQRAAPGHRRRAEEREGRTPWPAAPRPRQAGAETKEEEGAGKRREMGLTSTRRGSGGRARQRRFRAARASWRGERESSCVGGRGDEQGGSFWGGG